MSQNPTGNDTATGYSPQPKKRRGNRRATGGSSFTGSEPRLAGLAPTEVEQAASAGGEDERARWLKGQRPPHYTAP